MEIKKSEKANLENKKLLYREIGMVFTLIIVLAAFEWKSYDKSESAFQQESAAIVEVENVPITTEAPPEPPEAPKIPVFSNQIDIVDDDVELDDDLFISLEDTKDMGVEIMDYVEDVSDENIEEAPIPFTLVEKKPSFMGGGPNQFSKWVNKHMKYPESARENGVQGRVILQFTVNKHGDICNVKVLRGIDSSLDKEAVRVVESSPKWVPGQQRDKSVPVVYNFPIVFQLR
ncbi:MAG: energy transducer TonB [Bacteroidales bacterium]